MIAEEKKEFSYGEKGVIPLALVFYEGLYRLFCTIEDKKGIFLITSSDLITFDSITLVIREAGMGGGSAFIKNEKIYFFYSDKKGQIKSASLDKTGIVVEYPLPIVKTPHLFDPKIFYESNKFYLLCCDRKGNLYLFDSDNLINFTFRNSFPISPCCQIRCPSLHKVGEQWALFYQKNGWLCYQIANFDLENQKITLEEEIKIFDKISSPRISTLSEGRTILVGLCNDRMILREIWVREGSVHAFPLSELRTKKLTMEAFDLSLAQKSEFEIPGLDNFSVELEIATPPQNTILLLWGQMMAYPEYLWINTRDRLVVLSARGKPYPSQTKRDYFEENPQIEIFYFNDIIEVYFRKSGLILSSINPFKNTKRAVFTISSQLEIFCRVVVSSI